MNYKVTISVKHITVSNFAISERVWKRVVETFLITRACLPRNLNLPDQPNRRLRTRMAGGVGGTPCEGSSYPDRFLSDLNDSNIFIFEGVQNFYCIIS